MDRDFLASCAVADAPPRGARDQRVDCARRQPRRAMIGGRDRADRTRVAGRCGPVIRTREVLVACEPSCAPPRRQASTPSRISTADRFRRSIVSGGTSHHLFVVRFTSRPRSRAPSTTGMASTRVDATHETGASHLGNHGMFQRQRPQASLEHGRRASDVLEQTVVHHCSRKKRAARGRAGCRRMCCRDRPARSSRDARRSARRRPGRPAERLADGDRSGRSRAPGNRTDARSAEAASAPHRR